MVAKITVPGSIGRALNYNEQKVKAGKAKCLFASGFLKDAAELNFHEKLTRFENLIQLNKRASTNTVHISLNFAEGENLQEDKLREIATFYMEKIGFSAQPYLVYEHRDAGHPHVHVVSTNIRRDGSRISLHNLGKGPSQKARKELEEQFGLIKADANRNKESRQLAPGLTQKAAYGKMPTKQAITNVLDAVLPTYKYASLPELNAILKRYNVMADRGAENGVIYRTRGLVYRMLDESGNKVGVPVKASSIYNKPTLPYLEQQFRENALHKEAYKKQILSTINWVMVKPPKSFEGLEIALQKENVSLVTRRSEQGYVYGLTYIDHRSKCVFNGSDLGKAYSAKGVIETCGITQAPAEKELKQTRPGNTKLQAQSKHPSTKWNKDAALFILERVLRGEQQSQNIPAELKKQKKKRKKI